MIRSAISRAVLTLAAGLAFAAPLAAQQRGAPPPPPPHARAGAPVDLTGQWVAVVTEDWRWRMVTPAVGDVASIPLTPAAEAAARSWDLAADNAAGAQCRAYGAGGLLRLPLRLRISWEDDNTLRLESDAGQQVRHYRFIAPAPGLELRDLDAATAPAPAPSLQGTTRAQWFKQPQARSLGFSRWLGEGGALRAVTRHLAPGYLRLNGVPYSADAVITEQFNLIDYGNGENWLVVTTIVDDPANLTEPFITSSNFRRETDRSGWAPAPCHTDPPRMAPAGAPAE